MILLWIFQNKACIKTLIIANVTVHFDINKHFPRISLSLLLILIWFFIRFHRTQNQLKTLLCGSVCMAARWQQRPRSHCRSSVLVCIRNPNKTKGRTETKTTPAISVEHQFPSESATSKMLCVSSASLIMQTQLRPNQFKPPFVVSCVCVYVCDVVVT